MRRREFFKSALASVAAVIAARFVPKAKADDEFIASAIKRFESRTRIGSTLNIRKPMRYVIRQADQDLKAVTGIYEPTLGERS